MACLKSQGELVVMPELKQCLSQLMPKNIGPAISWVQAIALSCPVSHHVVAESRCLKGE